MLFTVIQCHRFWYEWKECMRIPISQSYLASFQSYSTVLVNFHIPVGQYMSLTHFLGNLCKLPMLHYRSMRLKVWNIQVI